jgi:hypothetical protein
MNTTKPFNSGLGQYMPKVPHPLGSVDSSNQSRWRGKLLNHHDHGGDVHCVVLWLCVAVKLIVCKKVPEHNLKVCKLPYHEVQGVT